MLFYRNFLKLATFSLFIIFVQSYGLAEVVKPTREEKKLLKKARKKLANEKYIDAKSIYSDLVKLSPKNDVYNFEAGLSYYFSSFERTKSIPYFEAALKNSQEDTIPELQYYLGKAYHLDGQHEKSKKTLNDFKVFIDNKKKAGKYLMAETNNYIKLNENGLEFQNTQNENIRILNLGKGINTSQPEYAPVYRKQDNVLIFTSRRKGRSARDLLPYEDIFVAKKIDDNIWEIVESSDQLHKYLPKNFNTKKHDAGIIYSIDGSKLYTYKKDALWLSVFENNEWSELEKLAENINNSRFNVPSISITHDGNTMFFVTTKRDGMGGKDIYRSTKSSNGEWSDPELLGPEINTPNDEDAPFLSKDGTTLYFSSKGHQGVGGYDIYKSELKDGKLSPAENVGLPINSSYDDIYFVLNEDDESGFFSSNRDGGFGAMDIYGFELSCRNIENTEFRGIVYNKTKQQPIDAKLILTETETGNIITETSTLVSNGKFLLVASPEKMYTLTIDAAGYQKQTLSLDIPKQCKFYPLFSEISMDNIELDGQKYQVATLRNSFFNQDEVVNSTIDTTNISNEVPLIKDGNDKDFDNNKMLLAYTRTINPSTTSINYSVISDTIKIENLLADTSKINNQDATNKQDVIDYQEFFAFNVKGLNTNSAKYQSFIDKVIAKVKSSGKVEISITSSASHVPTKTFKTNLNLASIRGKEAKSTLLKSLGNKGIAKDKIVAIDINPTIGGPKYTGDFQNVEKYKDFQYVKISVK